MLRLDISSPGRKLYTSCDARGNNRTVLRLIVNQDGWLVINTSNYFRGISMGLIEWYSISWFKTTVMSVQYWRTWTTKGAFFCVRILYLASAHSKCLFWRPFDRNTQKHTLIRMFVDREIPDFHQQKRSSKLSVGSYVYRHPSCRLAHRSFWQAPCSKPGGLWSPKVNFIRFVPTSVLSDGILELDTQTPNAVLPIAQVEPRFLCGNQSISPPRHGVWSNEKYRLDRWSSRSRIFSTSSKFFTGVTKRFKRRGIIGHRFSDVKADVVVKNLPSRRSARRLPVCSNK